MAAQGEADANGFVHWNGKLSTVIQFLPSTEISPMKTSPLRVSRTQLGMLAAVPSVLWLP